jgi:hypothetical protein
MIRKKYFFMGFLLLLLVCPVLSQETEDTKALLDQIQKAGGLKEHPDANALVIFEDYSVVFRESGEFASKEHSLVKILTDKGKQSFATRKIPYHRRYTTVNVLLARVIKKDGAIVPVPKESIRDGTMEETQQINILDENFRRLSMAFPGLELGDSIEMLIETVSQPLVKNNYNDLILFQGFEPLLEKEVTIAGPASKPLYFVVKDGQLEFSKEKKGDQVIYRWKKVNSPKIVEELGMASILDVALRVVVSTFKNWEELSRYGASLNVGKTEPNEALKAKVQELTKGLKTDEEKILAIFRYLSQKIRYMGSSMDLGAFIEPHPATYTFEKQYGVCRDKSLLMMTMLKEIGIKSYDTIINVSRQTEKEIPIIFFEHAICAVVLKDGRVVYMDPTMELSSEFGETYVGGRYVLLLDEKGKGLIKVPAVTAERSLGLIKGETIVLPDGSIEGKVNISGKGFYDFVLRSISKRVPSFQFPMVFQQLGQFLSSTIKVENVKSSDFADLAKPYEASFDFKAKDYLVDVGKYKMFKIPLSSQAFDIISIGIFKALTNMKERKYPLFLFSSRGCREEESVSLPSDFEVKAIPNPLELREGPVSLKISTSLKGDKIFFSSDFRIEKSSLNPSEYQSLRKVVKGLKRFQKAMVILQKKGSKEKGGSR